MIHRKTGKISPAKAASITPIGCAILVASMGLSAQAQTFSDAAICTTLLEREGAGLYLVQNRDGTTSIQRVNSAPVLYSAAARFYYVPSRKMRQQDNERQPVWHIRTQTRAAATTPEANQAYVFRPGGRSQCPPTANLLEFRPDDRFVDLHRYIDYHSQNSRKARETGLRDHFHFKFRDQGRCVGTDAAEFGDLNVHYGFDGTSRQMQAMQRNLTPSSAIADPALPPVPRNDRQFSGLSSEFSYQDQPGPACVGFAAPLPTRAVPVWPIFGPTRYQRALSAAEQWQPRNTLLVIKRVTGRKITEVMRRTVAWTHHP